MLSRLNRMAITGLAILLLAATAVPAENDNSLMKKVRKKYDKLQTLETKFTQTSFWALANEEQSEDGVLHLDQKNRYRIETDTQVIVSDGTTVWTYSKDRDQVIIDSVTKSKEHQLPKDILLCYTKDSKAELLGEPRIGGTPCYQLQFLPKDEDAFITSTKLWVNQKSLITLRIEQEDINENVTRFDLINTRWNPPLENSLFRFEIPATAEVIDLTSSGGK